MKKVALSLLAFALVGALAVAQDAPTLKLSGYLNTGVRIDAVGSAAVSTIYGDDAGNAWGRFDLNGSYGTDTNGVEFKLRTPNNTTAPGIEFAYAWSKLADGMVTVKAGKVDDGTFSTAGDIGGDFTDGNGIAVAVTPAAGFAVGANWILPTVDTTKSPSTPLAFAVSAAFTSEGLAKAQAAGKVVDSKLSEVLVGFGLLSVENLKFAVDAKLTNLAASGSKAAYKISENVSYTVSEGFSVGLLSYQYIWGSDIKNAKNEAPIGFDVKPNASYTVDSVTSVGASVNYHQGPSSADTLFGNDVAWVDVNPSATFTLSPAAKIIASYNLGYSLDKDKANYDLADQTNQALMHTLKVDFRYNF